MNVFSLPKFSPPAAKLWDKLPKEEQLALLANVYCGNCKDAVTIVSFNGAVSKRDLILNGQCKVCGDHITRVIEREYWRW
jgi:hypothetical protein